MKPHFEPPEVCPVCGAEVPPRARACPACGADENTGWSGEAATDGLDLPEEEFDYAAFVQEEFGGGRRPTGRQRWWWVLAVVVLIGFVWLLLLR